MASQPSDEKLFDAGDYNLFRYCHNDPIDMTDPMGLTDMALDPGPTHANQAREMDAGNAQWAMAKWADSSNNFQGSFAQFTAGQGLTMGQGQRSIADVAGSKVGSRDYLTSRASGNYPAGSNKCNKFVADVIEEATGQRPQVPYPEPQGFMESVRAFFRSAQIRDPSANDYANPNVNIPGLSSPRPLSEARRNDIIAQQHGRDGHAGVVVRYGRAISVDTQHGGIVVPGSWGFRPSPGNGELFPSGPPPVVRHYLGD
jgi:hypothetical protein